MQTPRSDSQRPEPRKPQPRKPQPRKPELGVPGQPVGAEDPDQLAWGQLRWVQRLAYQLCSDRALADDVGQEVLLAGFGGAPEAAPARRAWLTAAIRNRLRMARRGGYRRRDHELQAAADQVRVRSDGDGQASPDGVLERFEVHRQVSGAVARLREPYRSTLLKRYFEGLTPSAIAEADGLPVGTVKTRITRGLKELRGELEHEFGAGEDGGAGWFAALAPLAELHRGRLMESGMAGASALPRPVGLAAAGSRAGALWSGGWLAPWGAGFAALALVVALAVALFPGPGPMESPGTVRGPGAISPSRSARDAPLRSVATGRERTSAPGRPGARAMVNVPADLMVSLTVHVVDLEGQPVSGVDVVLESGSLPQESSIIGRSDGGGVLVARVPMGEARLDAASPGEALVIPGSILGAGSVQVATLVLAPARTVEGVVLGPGGLPLAGATLVYRSAVDLRLLQERPLNRASRPTWRATTDGDGVFRFPDVPELPASVLLASHGRYGSTEIEIEDTGAVAERVQLEDADRGVRGRVVTAAGDPVEGAYVASGTLAARTGAAGEFRMELAVGAEVEIRALSPGLGLGRWNGRLKASDEEVTIQLDGAACTLRGRVTLPNGAPAAGLRVLLLDRTNFGVVRDLVAGQAFTYCSAESLLAAQAGALALDQAGMFEAPVLEGRRYRIMLVDGATLDSVVTAPLRGGETLHGLLFEPSATVTVRGRVTDRNGEPLAGASVAASVRARTLNGGGLLGGALQGPWASTDGAGAFALEGLVPSDLLQLTVFAGPHFESASVPFDGGSGTAEIQLWPVAPFYVRCASEDARRANGFELRDPVTEEPRGLSQVENMGSFELVQGELESGRSPVYRVRAGRHLLVAMRGGEEVFRTTIQIRNHGDTQVIEL